MTPPDPAVFIQGIRHHSPACAHQVARAIARHRPRAVLIEGPSDFNPRLDELLLPHELPLALYSYRQTSGTAAQCWFPLLDYSPEWVALREGRAAGAHLRLIDLPHWAYRARQATADPRSPRPGVPEYAGRPSRYRTVVERLCQQAGCDGDDALWERWFELAPEADLEERLQAYFETLRGEADEATDDEEAARENYMAAWIAHERALADAQGDARPLLVVCGGWHAPALARLWPPMWQNILESGRNPPPALPAGAEEEAGIESGSYLIPFAFREVDALAGYAAGMPSPLYYQWLYEQGPLHAGRAAIHAITGRLRQKNIRVGTADLLAWQHGVQQLSALRGQTAPARVDVLDALLNSLVKEALDCPPPWANPTPFLRLLQREDHPILREALLALTGERRGTLAADTPQSPLLRDVERRLEALGLLPDDAPRTVLLNWREAADRARLHLLWQVHSLDLDSLKPASASRASPESTEAWVLQRTRLWHPQIIEASRFGATLPQAAQAALEQRLFPGTASPADYAEQLADVLQFAIRAGFADWGEQLRLRLIESIPRLYERAAAASLGQTLIRWLDQGFWADNLETLLHTPFHLVIARLVWLLDAQSGAAPPQSDIDATRVLAHALAHGRTGPETPAESVRALLARLLEAPDTAPTLRGAALGVLSQDARQYGLAAPDALSIVKRIPVREQLGDFLSGLFASARPLLSEEPCLVEAIHAALETLPGEDFLIALPALRGAFGWFSPRERRQIGKQVAGILGLPAEQQHRLIRPESPDQILRAKHIETQARRWLSELKGLS